MDRFLLKSATFVLLAAVVINVGGCQPMLTGITEFAASSTPFASPVLTDAFVPFVSAVATPVRSSVAASDQNDDLLHTAQLKPAVVTGVLLQNQNSPSPVGKVILCLGVVYLSEGGLPLAAGFDRQSAPCTQSDERGRFVFSGIPDGTYGLILDRAIDAFLLNDPATGTDMLVKINNGSSVELGRLVYRNIPGVGSVP